MEELDNVYEVLKYIQVNLRKLGLKREKYNTYVNNKIEEARIVYNNYKLIVLNLNKRDCNIKFAEYILENLISQIELTYKKILSYKLVTIPKITTTMDKFDLKTAATLLPCMDGSEDTINKLIDGIEMYNSCLEKKDCKKLLIKFVIATRLTKSGKLKLKSDYATCEDLIDDIKKYLLTKKSANALLIQLNNVSQGEMSISQYANKIEDLFVNLTISQSNSNEEACEVLKPINEQLAIKKFADGLRNRRLSTIIAARDYNNLKDAVRAAQDEESTQPPPNTMLNFKGRFSYRTQYAARGHNRGYQTNRGHNNVPISRGYQTYRGNFNTYNNNRYQSRGRFVRSRSNRGRVPHSRGYQMFTTNDTDDNTKPNTSEFFRS